jgi:hypothetical protein
LDVIKKTKLPGRTFVSAANRRTLAAAGIFDGLFPRSPAELSKKLQGKKFARLQRRRAQTEARTSILKQGFLGRPLRAKGFDHRELALACVGLTHNLWLLARLKKTKKQAQPRTPRPTKPLAVPLQEAA